MSDKPGTQTIEAGEKSRRLSGEPVLDADLDFPVSKTFQPPTQLPTYKSVLGRLRFLSSGGKRNMSSMDAAREVSKEIYCKYFHDSVYCSSFETIVYKVNNLWETYRKGKTRK